MAGKLILAAFVLGAATVPGFAPFYLYPLPIVTVAAFAIVLLRATSTRQAAAVGFAFGLGLLVTGASWAYVSLHVYGGMPVPLAALSTLIFNAAYAVCPAVASAIFHRFSMRADLKLLLLFPALLALSDWTRGWLFTGFPWLALGYSQAPSGPLAGYSALLGVYGVSLALAMTAACLALIYLRAFGGHPQFDVSGSEKPPAQRLKRLLRASRSPGLLAVAIVLFGFGLGSIEWTKPYGERPVSVTLVQGNIPQELKWRPEKARDTLISYLELTRSANSKLILLPETAIPMFDVNVPPGYLDALGEHARSLGGDLLTGIPELAGRGVYYNSVISLGTSPAQTYRKVHLVPFGDYFPMRWAFGWFMKMVDIPMSDFSRGDVDQPPIAAAGQRIAVNICYEDVFGEEIIRQLPEATILANFTNDAWWGRSLASRQHLQISQMRSLETGRSMLRATNTGVTAVIDHRGRVQAVAPEFKTTTIETEVWGYSGSTPYSRWGNYAFLVIALAMIAIPIGVSRARETRMH
ncbi:MAG: apolipoprotein N-acyltransferase [Betaproteobacteria bacterium]|nr:MAG: apolipoprotein N-acyltransferase [Betaproteobacteria bacterium]